MSYYYKPLIIKVMKQENILIADFVTPYVNLKLNSDQSFTLDATLSRDNFNILNRNFTYQWQCSALVPSQLCPSAFNVTKFSITLAQRKNYSMEIPGRLFEFRV